MIKLSIITINYNNKIGLKKTIGSVLQQTFKNLEYIVIDGGSIDGSVQVIEQHADKINYWISEKDKGIYNAMNKGIKVAKGEYCLFLNSGDYLMTPDILKGIAHELNGDEIVYGDGRSEVDGERTIQVEIPEKLTIDYFSDRSLFHPGAFIKRKLFETYGLYNEENKIVSDWEFFIKTILVNKVKARKILNEIAVVEADGISRKEASIEIIKQEIVTVLDRYFSPSEIASIKERKKMGGKGKGAMVATNKNLFDALRSKLGEMKIKWRKRK